MESPRIEEEKIIKYKKDLFRLKQVKKKQLIPQPKIFDTFLDYKKKIKELKTE